MEKDKLYKADNGKIKGRLIYPTSYFERIELSESFDINNPDRHDEISIDGFFAGKDVETEEEYNVRTYQHEYYFPNTPDFYTDNYVLFMNGITNIYGYWLMSSNPGGSHNARTVNYHGIVGWLSAYGAGNYGVRAVITVSTSDLS